MKQALSAAAASLLTVASSQAFAAENATTLLRSSADAVKTHQWNRGAEAAQKALELDLTPLETEVAYNNLCIHLTNLKEFVAASDVCDKAVALAPDRWNAYLNRGNLDAAMGRNVRANADYNKAQTLNPTNIDAVRADIALAFAHLSYSNTSYFSALLPPTGTQQMEQRVEVPSK